MGSPLIQARFGRVSGAIGVVLPQPQRQRCSGTSGRANAICVISCLYRSALTIANNVYPTFKTSILIADTNVALNNNTAPDQPFVSLNTGAYNSAHQFYSSMSGTNVGTEQNIGTPTVTAGTFDGNDVTFTAVTGSTVTALVFYRHNSGANTTWRLF